MVVWRIETRYCEGEKTKQPLIKLTLMKSHVIQNKLTQKIKKLTFGNFCFKIKKFT